MNKLSIKDSPLFARYLGLAGHELSVYSFQNIYIWKRLFDIRWLEIKDNLCIFFQDKIGCFLYLPPLGKKKSPEAVKKAFEIMDKSNNNKEISRIENIEEKNLPFYKDMGLECREKPFDYLCLREDLVNLKGDKFKSKRACFNYFTKNYQFEYRPFIPKHSNDCLKLYGLWAKQRKSKISEYLYQGMLQDSLDCLKILLNDYKYLNILGRVVSVEKEIRAFTFGFKLNNETFCILYEITDLSIKGLAQFIFRKFSSELTDYKYINIMDDSSLQNLKKVKLSYQPIRLVPSYIVRNKYE